MFEDGLVSADPPDVRREHALRQMLTGEAVELGHPANRGERAARPVRDFEVMIQSAVSSLCRRTAHAAERCRIY
ncbi:hypothetical protein [Xanthobacter sediminis]